jgi:hypothetical protein
MDKSRSGQVQEYLDVLLQPNIYSESDRDRSIGYFVFHTHGREGCPCEWYRFRDAREDNAIPIIYPPSPFVTSSDHDEGTTDRRRDNMIEALKEIVRRINRDLADAKADVEIATLERDIARLQLGDMKDMCHCMVD